MSEWYGTYMQEALLNCEIVIEKRFTETGPIPWHFLKLNKKLIPLGNDRHFADMLQFALRRNAEAFEGLKEQDPNETLQTGAT